MSRFLTILLCAMLSFEMSGCREKDNQPSNASCLEVIKNRTSIRQYTDQPVEKEKIDNLLRAGLAAPSAMNKQPWKLVALTNKAKINELGEATGKPPISKSTLTIIVCGDLTKTDGTSEDLWWTEDCGAVTENILLAATAQGLGAVWCGTWPSAERFNKAREVLRLPENLVPYSMIAIGYPNENPTPKDKFTEDNIIRIE
ncbi:MAG: nitroreductase family protein [Bacteroidales bacterium]|nr:nitroreductase family protein [Bacteroidales bacterium]